jgi:hypothetical protein
MQTIERAVVVLAASAVASLALVAAGCGADSPDPGVAQTPSSTTTTQPSESVGSTSDDPIAFAACMRSRGVPDFPDPKVTSQGQITSIPDDDSPHFRSALTACKEFLGNGGAPSPAQRSQEREELLRFAACMRAHGVPEFPDPTGSSSSVGPRADGIDRSSPRFAAAKKACRGSLAGVTGR